MPTATLLLPAIRLTVRLLLGAVLALALRPACTQAQDDPPNPLAVPPAPLHEQVLHLPGDPDRPVDLLVTLYMPEGPGPFSLAVMNHGSSGDGAERAASQRYRYTMSAYYFLSRGYAVALPMMRGFAGSGGTLPNYGCGLARLARQDGRDIAAILADLAGDPRIDSTRVVVAGQSFGGWNTLGVGALQLRHVRGLINFVGGIRSSACGDGARSLIDAAGSLGAVTRVPGIWFYGENDSLFGPAIWQPMHAAYTRAGAQAELVDIGRFMGDSHQLLSFPEGIPLWAPRLDAFLTGIGMPGREILPQYMPHRLPLPTGFAPVDDVAAVPWISAQARETYRKFIAKQPPKVFMIAPGGQAVATQGGFDPLGRALSLCRKAGLFCMPYAVDSDVVFIAPQSVPRPAATRFAALDDVAAVPGLNDKGRKIYRQFLAHALPRAFVLGAQGQILATYGGDPLNRAMTFCANARLACRPYAVDRDVVWVRPPQPLRIAQH